MGASTKTTGVLPRLCWMEQETLPALREAIRLGAKGCFVETSTIEAQAASDMIRDNGWAAVEYFYVAADGESVRLGVV